MYTYAILNVHMYTYAILSVYMYTCYFKKEKGDYQPQKLLGNFVPFLRKDCLELLLILEIFTIIPHLTKGLDT